MALSVKRPTMTSPSLQASAIMFRFPGWTTSPTMVT